MSTDQVEYDILDSTGEYVTLPDSLQLLHGLTGNRRLGSVPVIRVTKARGSAIFVTGSTVRRLIIHFLNSGRHIDPLSNPQTCLKVLTMLIFKWTGARMGDIAAPEGSEEACLR
jgi:hypothetical protein